MLNLQTVPDALFHQLLVAMGHPDYETRIGAHRILSSVLMPSLVCPWSDQNELASLNSFGPSSILSTLEEKSGRFSIPEKSEEKVQSMRTMEDNLRCNDLKESRVCRSHSKLHSFETAMTNGKMVRMNNYAQFLLFLLLFEYMKFHFCLFFVVSQELASLRLSSHHVSLLLSSIWAQATFRENTPSNFEAMAHTYSIALLLTRTKVRFFFPCLHFNDMNS